MKLRDKIETIVHDFYHDDNYDLDDAVDQILELIEKERYKQVAHAIKLVRLELEKIPEEEWKAKG